MAHRSPVFVDTSGRRRRLIRRVGLAVAVLLTGYLTVVGVGLFVGADVPLSPWPGNGRAGTGTDAQPGGGHGTPQPTVRPTTARPGTSPPAGATPSGPVAVSTAVGTTRGAATTPPARPGFTPPGRTKSPNPRKP